jgi:hypothetical protein
MADDRVETREMSWRQLFPWTELFRGFWVALSPSKLLLAAAGIVVMAVSWYILAAFFFAINGSKPTWPTSAPDASFTNQYPKEDERLAARWRYFNADREHWNLMYETAGPAVSNENFEAADLADNPEQYDAITQLLNPEKGGVAKYDEGRARELLDHIARQHRVTRDEINQLAASLADRNDGVDKDVLAKALIVNRNINKPSGMLATMPWYENRGPNPFLLATGQAGQPWEAGHFWDWLLTRQVPVLVEPLVKFLRPVIYFFSPRAGWLARLYLLLVIVATLATWAFFGAAITRMAAVEVARNEKISALDALRFVGRRYSSYALAPIFPLILVAVIVVALIVYGLLHMIPFVGDIVIDGLFWWLAIGGGLAMACFLFGLVSWPLMITTISTEDEEGFNAFARAYSYLVQAPWHYLWYAIVALAYGAVVVFFVSFMGSLAVYLASWGENKGTFVQSRNPSYLFVYAPTSWDWDVLLLEGASVTGSGGAVVQNGAVNTANYNAYVGELWWYQKVGAWLVSIWLGIFFLLILGFAYSYFWSASSIIYLLMRRHVDDAEMDEVYFEEDEQEEYPLGPPAAPSKTAAPAMPQGTTMVEAPSLRVSTPSTAAAPPPPPAAPPVGPPQPVGADRVEEPVRPATTTVPPPADLPRGGDGTTPPPGETPM